MTNISLFRHRKRGFLFGVPLVIASFLLGVVLATASVSGFAQNANGAKASGSWGCGGGSM